MAAIELKFIPVGFIHPKTETGKKGSRWERDNPLNYSSRIEGNKFYLFFSITKLNNFSGKPLLWLQILDEKNNIIRDNTNTGGHTINQAGLDFFKTDRIDRSSGLFLRANEVLEPSAVESTAKMIHGKAWFTANNRQISNIVTFSMEKTPTIGTGFQRGQAYQAPITEEPVIVTGTKPFEKPERISVFKTTVSKAPIEILPMAAAEPEPIITISPKIRKIIDDWSVKKIIVPSWFANNNMNWVLQGKITEAEFLAAYNNLVKTGIITFTITEPTPEVDLDFNGVSTPATTQGGEEILVTAPTEPAKPTKPAEALPIGFTGIIAALVVLGGLFSWRNK